MANFRQVADRVFVSPQITEDDIAEAAADGFTLIINNRPDGEEPGQPANETLQSVANDKGLAWATAQITSGQPGMDAIEAMAGALNGEDGKVLAYCRSGTRSCMLWAMAEAMTGTLSTGEILNRAQGAGYDMSPLAPTLDHLRGNR